MVRIEGDTLAVMQQGPWFERALDGRRTNVMFSLHTEFNAELLERRPRIRWIKVYNQQGNEFHRRITSMDMIGAFAGAYFWVITWSHERVAAKLADVLQRVLEASGAAVPASLSAEAGQALKEAREILPPAPPGGGGAIQAGPTVAFGPVDVLRP